MSSPDDSPPAANPAPSSPSAAGKRLGIETLGLVLALGLVSGIVAWGIGEAMLIPEAGFQSKKENILVSPSVAGIRNGTICFGALGAVMGLGMGIAGGLIRRSIGRAALAGATGLLVGAGVGVALTQCILPIYYEHATAGDITYSLLVHAGIWTSVAAAAGLAFAVGQGAWRGVTRAILGSAAAGLLAAVIYEFAGGIMVPTALTDRPISQTWETRLMARLLVTLLVAAGVVLCAEPPGAVKDARASRVEG